MAALTRGVGTWTVAVTVVTESSGISEVPIHRHLYFTIRSGLFCARVRQKLSPSTLVTSGELLTMEQVRRAANVFLDVLDLPGPQRRQRSEQELQQQHYHQRRNAASQNPTAATTPPRIDASHIKNVFAQHHPG